MNKNVYNDLCTELAETSRRMLLDYEKAHTEDAVFLRFAKAFKQHLKARHYAQAVATLACSAGDHFKESLAEKKANTDMSAAFRKAATKEHGCIKGTLKSALTMIRKEGVRSHIEMGLGESIKKPPARITDSELKTVERVVAKALENAEYEFAEFLMAPPRRARGAPRGAYRDAEEFLTDLLQACSLRPTTAAYLAARILYDPRIVDNKARAILTRLHNRRTKK